MENASKALIIAGAILLSILIIAIGMMVYQGAKGSVDNAMHGMDATEIATWNQKYESYEGASKRGVDAKNLITQIMTDNQTNKDNAARLVDIKWLGPKRTTGNGNIVTTFTTTENAIEDADGRPGPEMLDLQTARDEIDTGRNYAIYAYQINGIVREVVITENRTDRLPTYAEYN